MAAQVGDGSPGEGADGNHDHDRDQRRHRDLRYLVTKEDNQAEQHQSGRQGGKASAPARLHVNHRLTDHGAARHAADKCRADVGNTLRLALAVFIARGVGHVVHDSGSHHGFQQSHHGKAGRIRQDNQQRIQVQRNVRNEEYRQAVRQFAHVAHGANVQVQPHGNGGQHHDADQRGGNGFIEVRKEVDDCQASGGERINVPGHVCQLRQLRHEYQNGQRVDEACHNRARHVAHQAAKLQVAGSQLQQAG